MLARLLAPASRSERQVLVLLLHESRHAVNTDHTLSLCQLRSAQSTLPNTSYFTWFLALLGAGAVFEVLAFTLFLPVIILAPSKFAICFTIGSVLIMAAFVSLRGWRSQLAHMFSAERLPFSIGAPALC